MTVSSSHSKGSKAHSMRTSNSRAGLVEEELGPRLSSSAFLLNSLRAVWKKPDGWYKPMCASHAIFLKNYEFIKHMHTGWTVFPSQEMANIWFWALVRAEHLISVKLHYLKDQVNFTGSECSQWRIVGTKGGWTCLIWLGRCCKGRLNELDWNDTNCQSLFHTSFVCY